MNVLYNKKLGQINLAFIIHNSFCVALCSVSLFVVPLSLLHVLFFYCFLTVCIFLWIRPVIFRHCHGIWSERYPGPLGDIKHLAGPLLCLSLWTFHFPLMRISPNYFSGYSKGTAVWLDLDTQTWLLCW